jgi:hypothetical protein
LRRQHRLEGACVYLHMVRGGHAYRTTQKTKENHISFDTRLARLRLGEVIVYCQH